MLRGTIGLPGPDVGGVALRDRLAFVANGAAGVVVIDLADPAAPQRLAAVPVVGTALDVALSGNLLLVAAGSAGLRVLDLSSPGLGELGFVALPGGGQSVVAQGTRAYVACSGHGAQLATVDLTNPKKPRLLALSSQAPAERDLLASGLSHLSVSGSLVLATAALTDQNAKPVKGLLSASLLRPDGSLATFAHANLPTASSVSHAHGEALALLEQEALAAFVLPQLAVTAVTPFDGQDQIALNASVSVELSAPPDPATVTAANVVLRFQDPVIGPAVPATLSVQGQLIVVAPQAALQPAAQYFLQVGTGVATATGLALFTPFTSSFRTRTSAGTPPLITDVQPTAGPVDGGTVVTLFGSAFAPGSRVLFSGSEATAVHVDPSSLSLTCITPPQFEGPATVTVIGPDGLQASMLGGFVYLPFLQLSFVVPPTGSLHGGQPIELSGAGFESGATVKIGASYATQVRVLSPGRISARTPPGPFGPADVRVDLPDGRKALAPAAYVYSNLVVSSSLGRYDPKVDGPLRPAHKLAQGVPGKLALVNSRAYLLQRANIAASSLTPEKLLENSVFGSLAIVDVSTATAASVLGGLSFQPPYDPVDLIVRFPYALVLAQSPALPYLDNIAGAGGSSLLIVDVSTPSGPTLVTAVPFEGSATQLAMVGDLLLVATGDGGVLQFSVADPSRPLLLGSIDRFLINGQVRHVRVDGVRPAGSHALVISGAVALVVDLTVPGLNVVGQLDAPPYTSSIAALSTDDTHGLMVAEQYIETVSLSPPARARLVTPIDPFIPGMLFSAAMLGPHISVAAGTPQSEQQKGPGIDTELIAGVGLLQLFAAHDPALPRSVDAVSLFPASAIADVAIDAHVAVTSVQRTFSTDPLSPPPQDGLQVVALAFPLVAGTAPADGDRGVATSVRPVIDMSVPTLSGVDSTTVQLLRDDGSVNGAAVPVSINVTGGQITLVPASALAPSASFRLLVDGVSNAATGSPMPAPFLASFTTASADATTPLSLADWHPRQGPAAGGTTITLVGTGFQAGIEVKLGAAEATINSVSADGTTVNLITPASAAGASSLFVRNPSGGTQLRVGAFLFNDPLTVAQVSPNRGPANGGTRVLITGTGFSAAGNVSVSFGGAPAQRTRLLGLNQIETFTPANLRGTVDVTVQNPDGVSAKLKNGYTFDQPTASSIGLSGEPHDVAVVGTLAFVATSTGLVIIDLAYPVIPSQRGGLVDLDHNGVDDRIVSFLGISAGEPLSVAYPAEGGRSIFLGLRGGGVVRVDVGDPAHPRVIDSASAGSDAVWALDARGDRLLAAAGAGGLFRFDTTSTPFPIDATDPAPGVQALAAQGELIAAGRGARGTDGKVALGLLQLYAAAAVPQDLGALPMAVQKVRLNGNLAAVAAGAAGLILVDVTNPLSPAVLSTLSLGDFAWDVRLAGGLAYVAAGSSGVAVVDVTQPANPRLLYTVAGANGGEARKLFFGGAQLITLRTKPNQRYSFDFGEPGALQLLTSSVAPGEVVPLDLASILLVFSTVIDPGSALGAFSLTADGAPVAGVIEAGTADAPASTILFRLSAPLPASAQLHLAVGTALTDRIGDQLSAPFAVDFLSAAGAGELPVISQLVPRIGPVAGGQVSELLGSAFDLTATVLVGGIPATVMAASPTQLTILVPPGLVGLADVTVHNGSGVSTTLAGGYLYVAPINASQVLPRFLDPTGGTIIRVAGAGFLPSWASSLGSTHVLVRGLPATSVAVLDMNHLTAVLPPGSFGAAAITVVSADGVTRSLSSDVPVYGLPFSAEEKAVSVSPYGLVSAPGQPQLLYAAAGAGADGNRFDQPYIGPITGGGIIPESFRVVDYDVGTPGKPQAAGAQIVQPKGTDADLTIAAVRGMLLEGTPVPEAEVMPDSLDVKVSGSQLLIANGLSGLSILDATDPLHLPLLGRVHGNALNSDHTTRVVPTATGAVVLTAGLSPRPDGENLCITQETGYGTGGKVFLVDTRVASDPVVLGSYEVESHGNSEPYNATIAGGRLYVVSGGHQGTIFCPNPDDLKPPPPPESSMNGGSTHAQRDDYAGAQRGGALNIFPSLALGTSAIGHIDTVDNLVDVVVVRGVAIVADAEFGLRFYDVTNPALPTQVAQLPFDDSLSNHPGQPERLHLYGDVLWVAANAGGPVLVDVSDPRHPSVVSAGNTQRAHDLVPVGDRLLLAGGDKLIELVTPFSLITGTAPARGDTVPPALPEVAIYFNRPLAPPSITTGNVRLVGPSGNVPLQLSVTADFGNLIFAVHAAPQTPLAPSTSYEIQVDTTVTDQRGGALLLPLRSAFQTAPAGALQPAISSLSPATASRAGGTVLALHGSGLSHATSVSIGGAPAAFTVLGDAQLTVTAPAQAATGPADVLVIDAQGLQALLVGGVLYLDDPAATHYAVNPDHGPVAGGTQASVSAQDGLPFAPGTQVMVGGIAAANVHVRTLGSVSFDTPRSIDAVIAPVQIVRPGEGPVTVGTFSYDLPVTDKIRLPGFPPRAASEIRLVGTTLYVGVATPNFYGLEIFDVTLPERPIRLGGVQTAAPVRSLDVSGGIAVLALDSLGIVAVDVSDPANALIVSHAVTLGNATAVRISGSTAYVATADPGLSFGYLQSFDISTPGLPLIGSLPMDADLLALDLGVSQGAGRLYALTTNLQGGQGAGLSLTIYSSAGARLGSIVILPGVGDYQQLVTSRVAVRSGRAYVTVGMRLYVFDLSDEQSPVALASTDLGAETSGLTFAGGALFVAGGGSVLKVPASDLLVVSVSPAAGALASVQAQVRLELTLPVAPASVTAASFSVTSDSGSGAVPLDGARDVQFTLHGSVLTFTPAAPLVPGALVHVHLADVTGFVPSLTLAAPFDSSFTVAPADALQPVIATVSPVFGLADQPTPVAIQGTGFRASTRVFVGGAEASVIAATSTSTKLNAIVPVSPTLSAGLAAVTVLDQSGLSDVRQGAFSWRDRLRVVSVNPGRSPQSGGVQVEVRGAGFAPGLAIAFGGTRSFSVQVLATDRALAIAPPENAGVVDLTATQDGFTATLPKSFLYGEGAVAALNTPPIADLIINGTVAYAALGGAAEIIGTDGHDYGLTKTVSGGLLVADLSEPTSVRSIATLNFTGSTGARRLALAGTRLYVAAGAAGVEVVDVSLPAQPKLLGTLATTGDAADVAAQDDVLFVADDAGLTEYAANAASLPLKIASLALPGVSAVRLAGKLLLAASIGGVDGPTLHVLDAVRSGHPESGKLSLPLAARHISVEGTRAFVSLGSAGQVAIVQLFDPTTPAPAGTIVLAAAADHGRVSAEQTVVAGGIVYVAAGGGKLQRYSAPVGAQPALLATPTVFGYAQALAVTGHYLIAGTLFLDSSGTAVALPIGNPADAHDPLAGAIASVQLDHLELRSISPAPGSIAPANTQIFVTVTDLPDPATAAAITLEQAGAPIPVSRRVQSAPEGGAAVLTPLVALTQGAKLVVRVGASLADLRGGQLGVEALSSFTVASDATTEQPRVDSITPSSGLTVGGDQVQILGSGFLPAAIVRIGGSTATVTAVAPNGRSISAITPAANAAGLASVEVQNPSGLGALREGAYRYLLPPHISSFTPVEAPMNSGAIITVTGTGLFAGSQVLFGGVPAAQVALDPSGSLLVTLPNNVVGKVDFSVGTQAGPSFVADVKPQGFAITLPRIAQANQITESLAQRGLVVLTAGGGRLAAYDLSFAESPTKVADVPGVPVSYGLAITGQQAFLAGDGVVVRYDLDRCGTAPLVACNISEVERISLDFSGQYGGSVPAAIAATDRSAYVAVANTGDVALLGDVGGHFAAVAELSVSPAFVHAVAVVGGSLAILIQDYQSGNRLELRSLVDGRLALQSTLPLTYGADHLAAQGTQLAFVAQDGVHLVDATDPTQPIAAGLWPLPASRSLPTELAFAGPWILAGEYGGVQSWLDTTSGPTMTERTWLRPPDFPGYPAPLAIASGVALVGGNSLQIFDLPYPTPTAFSPIPGGALTTGGALSATLSDRLPLAVSTATSLQLAQGASPIPGTLTQTANTVRFTPSGALAAGQIYSARIDLGAGPALGANLLGTWIFPVVGAAAGSSLQLASLSPDFGNLGGGTAVQITGAGFDATTTVQIGGRAAQIVGPISATGFQILTPPGSAGPALVHLQASSGESLDVPSGFVYVAPLAVASVAPPAVDLHGGTVHLIGTGLTRSIAATVGAVAEVPYHFVATGFDLDVPAGPVGRLDIVLTQPGTAPLTLPQAVLRKDFTPPKVLSVNPLDQVAYDQVPLASVFVVHFDKPIDPATAGGVRLFLEASTELPVPGARTVSADGLSITFTPSQSLSSTTPYRLGVDQIQDTYGNIEVGYSHSFRTADVLQPLLAILAGGTPLQSGAHLAAGVDWIFTLQASDDSGQAPVLTFKIDGLPVSPTAGGLFHYTWPLSASGTMSTLKATATDGSNNVATQTLTVQLTGDQPPLVAFTAPLSNVTLEEGTSLTVSLSATDDHQLSRVELRYDGVAIARVPEPINQPSAQLTYQLVAPRVGAAAETHSLTTVAVDDIGQPGSPAPVTLTIQPDHTAPVAAFVFPAVSEQLVSGAQVTLRATASDTNGIAKVIFSVDGVDQPALFQAPWILRWTAPTVAQATAVLLGLRAYDPRGNTAPLTRSVTVAPASARPYVYVNRLNSYDPHGSTPQVVEGSAVKVEAQASSPAGIASVQLSLGSAQVTLTQPPWSYTFAAPSVTAKTAFAVRAVATDSAGVTSTPDIVSLNVTDDGKAATPLTFSAQPSGPLFLGGSQVQTTLADSQAVSGSVTVSVGAAPVGAPVPLGTGAVTLPLGPDGAAVLLSASAQTSDNGLAAGSLGGTLARFLASSNTTDLQTRDAIAALALQGTQLLLARDGQGGQGTLELRSGVDGSFTARAPLAGTPVGVAFFGARAAVALRLSGADSVQLFSLPSLQALVSFPLRRPPAALAAVQGALAVATDEGLDLLSSSGVLLTRVALGPVTGLAADGERLLAVAGGVLFSVDATVPAAAQVVASAAVGDATVVAAIPSGACAAGSAVQCFSGAALTAAGSAPLPSKAQSASALGSWAIVGTASGLLVADGRSGALAGWYPYFTGTVAASGANVFGAGAPRAEGDQTLGQLTVSRGDAAPTLSIALPSLQGFGQRAPLTANLSLPADPLNGYTAELLVDGVVVEQRNSSLPSFVDLPQGASTQISLRVSDLSGQVITAQQTVALHEDGAAPTLAALQVPATVKSGASLTLVALPADPSRVASVEFSLQGSVAGTVSAPALALALQAPSVSIDTQVVVSAVAIDSQSRRGPALQTTLLVQADATAAPQLSLARLGSGPIFEGAFVQVRATVTSIDPVTVVRFSVNGVESALAAESPFQASLLMPLAVGAHSVPVTAVAVDAQGRVSPLATLALIVVDDLTAPQVSLVVDPSGPRIAPGSRLLATATATDNVQVRSLSLQLTAGATLLASGGSTLGYVIPASLAAGTTLTVRATAVDPANNSVSVTQKIIVDGQGAPSGGPASAGSFTNASSVSILGDLVAAIVPGGVELGQLVRGATPGVTPLALYATATTPLAALFYDRFLLVARGGALSIDVVDVSNPASPRLVGSGPPPLNPSYPTDAIDHLFATAGRVLYTYRYTGSAQSTTEELDLSDPTSPARQLTQIYGGMSPVAADVDGLATWDGYTMLLSSRTGSQTGFSLAAPGPQSGAYVSGDTFLLGLVGQLQVWSVRDPQSLTPQLLSTLPLAGTPRAIAVAGNLAWLACDDGTLRGVDLTDPAAAYVTSTELLDARALDVSGGILVAAGPGGLSLRSLPQPAGAATSSALGTLQLSDLPVALASAQRTAIAGANTAGVVQVGLTDPSLPVNLRASLSGRSIGDVQAGDGGFFFLDGTALGFGQLDSLGALSVPYQNSGFPQTLHNLGPIERFAAARSRLWTAGGGGISTLLYADNSVAGPLVLGVSTTGLAGTDRLALVGLGNAGMTVLAIDNFGAPQIAAQVPGSAVTAVGIAGTLALAGNATTLAAYDLTTPASPVLLSTVSTAGAVRRIRMLGRLALVAEGNGGVELWDYTGTPLKVGSFPAGRAEDATVVGESLIVADSTVGVTTFALPATSAAPVVELSPLPSTVEAGTILTLSGAVSGLFVDELSLLENGQPVARLSVADPRARYRLPETLAPGTRVSLQLEARHGAVQAFSAPAVITVGPTSTPAPVLSNLSVQQGSSLQSGAEVDVSVRVTGGLPPYAVQLRLGSILIGALPADPVNQGFFSGSMRMPAVASQLSAALVADLTDAAGRTSSASLSVVVSALPPGPLAAPFALPTLVRAGPYLNDFYLNDANCFEVRLQIDGVDVASSRNLGFMGPLNGFHETFTLPANAAGTSITLSLIASDLSGQTSVVTQTYTVLPDEDAPTLPTLFVNATNGGEESTTAYVNAQSSVPGDGNIQSFQLFADGVLIPDATTASSPTTFSCLYLFYGQMYQQPCGLQQLHWSVSAPGYLLPKYAAKQQVTFTAVITTQRGAVAQATLVQPIKPATPPVIEFQTRSNVSNQTQVVIGDAPQLCAAVTPERGRTLATVTATVNGAAATVFTGGLYYNPQYCVKPTVTAAGVDLIFLATDDLGNTGSGERTWQAVPDAPLTLSLVASNGVGTIPDNFVATGGATYSLTAQMSGLNPLTVTSELDGVLKATSYTGSTVAQWSWTTEGTGGSHLLTVHGTDTLGVVTVLALHVTVTPATPPTITLPRTDYFVAQNPSPYAWSASDAVSVSSNTVSINGVALPYSGYSFAATAPGTAHIVGTAINGSGLSAVATQDVPVLAAGTGLSCAKALALRSPYAAAPFPDQLIAWSQSLPSQNVCYGVSYQSHVNQGAYVSLPFDGPVDSLKVSVNNAVVVPLPSCNALPAYGTCSQSSGGAPVQFTMTSLPKSATLFLYATGYSDPPALQLLSGKLGTGALCDPSNSNFTCTSGSCEPAPDGNRCAVPPSLTLNVADGGLLQGGTTFLLAASATSLDASPLASLSIAIDGSPVASVNASGASATASYPWLLDVGGGAHTVSATAVDGFGLTSTKTAHVTVSPAPPPSVSIGRVDYLVAGAAETITATASDVALLASVTLSADGNLVSSLVSTQAQPYQQATLSGPYAAPVEATATLVATAVSSDSQRTTATLTVPVLPAGSGLDCSTPVLLPNPFLSNAPADFALQVARPAAAPQLLCDNTQQPGTWVALPFDGPVDWIYLNVTNGVPAVVSSCGAPASCAYDNGGGIYFLNPGANNLLFIEATSNLAPVVKALSASLGVGALCEPNNPSFFCGVGTCGPDGQGKNRCPLPAPNVYYLSVGPGGQYALAPSLDFEAATDSASINYLALLLDGVEVARVNGTDVKFHWTPMVPGPHTLSAHAVDTHGQVGDASAAFTVLPDQPPVVSPDLISYLVAQNPQTVSAGFADDVALTSISITGNGASLAASAFPSGILQTPLAGLFTAASPGTAHFVFSATDNTSQTTTVEQDVPILPAGTGFSCAEPVALPLSEPLALAMPNAALQAQGADGGTPDAGAPVPGGLPQTWCDASTVEAGAYLSLPVTGPLDYLYLVVSGADVSVVTSCSAAPTQCTPGAAFNPTQVLISPVPAGAMLFVRDTIPGLYQSGSPFFGGPSVQLSYAYLPDGSTCDPASPNILCTNGNCSSTGAAGFVCLPSGGSSPKRSNSSGSPTGARTKPGEISPQHGVTQ